MGRSSPRCVGNAAITLGGKERETFWKSVERLGTPKARLAGLGKRKATWVREGLVARVRHLQGEETLLHASIQGLGHGQPAPDDDVGD